MLTKNELKYYSSLLKKKFRDEEGKFLIEGKKLIDEAFTGRNHIEVIFVTNEFAEKENDYLQSLQRKNIRTEVIKNPEFNKLSDTVNPQGIAAVLLNKTEINFAEAEIIAALEDVSDPGNTGTILRNCDWFGVNSVILSETCADVFNPKTIRASMGSLFHLSIKTSFNFIDDLHLLKEKGYKIITADLNGNNIYEYNFDEKFVIVFANEAKGPSKDLLNMSNDLLTIPKFGKAESLNVANSSAVIFSEIKRRLRS